MGIPAYFRQIIKEYSDTHFWKDDMDVDNLYIDFNSMIYGVIPQIDIKLNHFDYEDNLIKEIIKRLHHVINDVIKPKKIVYIAVDGTPPRAKMVQQRSRRYKTLKEQNFIRDTEKKFKVNIQTSKWNKSAISPGTTFMIKLSKNIIRQIQLKTFGNLTVIFSDDSVPGEGEHKILPNLRKIKGTGEVSVIYSPDADLIVLSIMSGVDNIFILREPKDSDIEINEYKDNEFLYLSIDSCKKSFNESVGIEADKERILVDYSFMTFLCGNDFVNAIPFLKMKDGGIDLLIGIYKTLFAELDQFLVNSDYTVNFLFLFFIFKELAKIEEDSMKKWQRKRDRIRRGEKPEKDSDMLKEPWDLEISRFNHEEYYSPKHPLHHIFNKVFDKIDYYSDKWVEQYNNHFFNGIDIDTVCKDYIDSLNFCLEYYFKGPPSWTWYYPHRNSPSVKDLFRYIGVIIDSEDEISLSALNTKWELGKPFTQFEQLMLILPRQSFRLLPKNLDIEQYKSIEEFYPKNFILDIVQGHKYIYSEPILPEIPIDIVRDIINSVSNKFSINEKERNTLRFRPYIFKGN